MAYVGHVRNAVSYVFFFFYCYYYFLGKNARRPIGGALRKLAASERGVKSAERAPSRTAGKGRRVFREKSRSSIGPRQSVPGSGGGELSESITATDHLI